MLLENSIWQIVSATIVFFFGFLVAIRTGRALKTKSRRAINLYLWHTFFCMVYGLYVTEYGGDAVSYYMSSLNANIEFKPGTVAVQFLTMYLSYYMGLSFLGVCLVYNIIGFIGLIAFDSALRSTVDKNNLTVSRLVSLIILLPSVSFWTSGIGKDSLAFM